MARPTHNLCIRRREPNAQGKHVTNKVGVGWYDPITGNMGIQLEDGVHLDWTMTGTHTIVCYENEHARLERQGQQDGGNPYGGFPDPDDNIPF